MTNPARDLAATGTQGEWRAFAAHGRDWTDEGWSVVGIKVDQIEVALTYPIGVERDECEADAEKAARAVNALPAIADLLDALADSPMLEQARRYRDDPDAPNWPVEASIVAAWDAVAAALTGGRS